VPVSRSILRPAASVERQPVTCADDTRCLLLRERVYRWGGHGQVLPEHTYWFCENTLRRVLQINGFSRITMMLTGHRRPVPVRRAASLLAQRLLPPRLALDSLVAVAYVD
jgi:hypothetical protein